MYATPSVNKLMDLNKPYVNCILRCGKALMRMGTGTKSRQAASLTLLFDTILYYMLTSDRTVKVSHCMMWQGEM